MSGLFGILDSKANAPIDQYLSQATIELSHRDWYIVETYRDQKVGVGLGRVGIGIFNQEKQPVCSEDGELIVFLSGELYNTSKLRGDLGKKGYKFRDESDLEVVLRLYQDKEEQFIYDIEGAFITAIWDRRRQKLVMANDRFGLYPTYYAYYNGKVVFAPQMQGVICAPGFRKELSLPSLAEYMRFQQLFGQKTFFEGLHLFPHGSVLTYDINKDRLNIAPYWDFSDIPELPNNVNYEEALEETGRLLKQVTNRFCSDSLRPGVYLSGGHDSRLILGLIERQYFPVVSVTYGQRNCRDVVYAGRIAREVGSDHYWFELKDGNSIKEFLDLHIEATGGFHSWVHAHGMSTLPHARRLMDVNISGWAIDYVVGGWHGNPLLMDAVDDIAFTSLLFHLFNQKLTWPGIQEAEEHLLYEPTFYPQLKGMAFESFKQQVDLFGNYDYPKRAEYFDQANLNRLTSKGSEFRTHFEIRYPAYDYRLYDFVCSIPMHMRMDRRLQIDILTREAPSLSRIPRDSDETLPTNNRLFRNAHALAYKLKNRINRHIYPLFIDRPTLYIDFENNLRRELRSWAEAILFDKRTLERGIFNPKFIQSIWARHLSGKELHTIGKIAPIITYEKILRRFYD